MREAWGEEANTALFPYFYLSFYHAAPQLTQRLEEDIFSKITNTLNHPRDLHVKAMHISLVEFGLSSSQSLKIAPLALQLA